LSAVPATVGVPAEDIGWPSNPIQTQPLRPPPPPITRFPPAPPQGDAVPASAGNFSLVDAYGRSVVGVPAEDIAPFIQPAAEAQSVSAQTATFDAFLRKDGDAEKGGAQFGDGEAEKGDSAGLLEEHSGAGDDAGGAGAGFEGGLMGAASAHGLRVLAAAAVGATVAAAVIVRRQQADQRRVLSGGAHYGTFHSTAQPLQLRAEPVEA
jgi:hypothetical protein